MKFGRRRLRQLDKQYHEDPFAKANGSPLIFIFVLTIVNGEPDRNQGKLSWSLRGFPKSKLGGFFIVGSGLRFADLEPYLVTKLESFNSSLRKNDPMSVGRFIPVGSGH
jgi:hypothetical protein